MKKGLYILALVIMVLAGCEKDPSTADISRVIPRPEIRLNGEQYVFFTKGSINEYEDPGAKAFVNESQIEVYSFEPEIDFEEPGVYIFQYFTQSLDGLTSFKNRVVTITYDSAEYNELDGRYNAFSYWSLANSRVQVIDSNGVYKCSDILAYPGIPVEGIFVDIGRQELVLLPGESFLGNYGISHGIYDPNNLRWEINLLDAPYEGVSIPVVLSRE